MAAPADRPRVERVLRQTLHKLEEQLKEEGIAVPFIVVVNEAILAKNAFTTVGGHTPYRPSTAGTPS